MPEPLDAEAQAQYLHMAEEQPGILCNQIPDIILEFAAAEAEPTPFMEEFFAVGYARLDEPKARPEDQYTPEPNRPSYPRTVEQGWITLYRPDNRKR